LHENQYLAGLWQLEGANEFRAYHGNWPPERRGNVVLTVFLA